MNYDLPVFFQDKPVVNIVIKQPSEPEKPKEPKLYTIKKGDNLTKIAEAQGTSVSRLWNANPELTDPDRIEPEKPLKIPEPDEVLAERPLPESQVSEPGTASVPKTQRTGRQSSGWYYAGQCTAYVASRRYVPDGWGNATDWRYHAQSEGWTVSSEPVPGAIGWVSGHVVYVESVNGDGTVTISEQNYDWNGSIRTITVSVGKYLYLY